MNNIEAKKEQFLERNLFLSGAKDRQATQEILATIDDGGTSKASNAKFKVIHESRKHGDAVDKDFFIKEHNFVESKYGSDIFRILSNKQYSAKREALVLNEENGEVFTAIKYDTNLSGNFFLGEESDRGPVMGTFYDLKSEVVNDKKFVKNYARMCGVLYVLGEADDNPMNFLRDKENGRPAKIDNGFLVNSHPAPFGAAYVSERAGFKKPKIGEYSGKSEDIYPGYGRNPEFFNIDGLKKNDRFRIYGCAQSRGFLKYFLGQDEKQGVRKSLSDKSEFRVDLNATLVRTAEDKNLTSEDGKPIKKSALNAYSKAFIRILKDGIDDELLGKIKDRIKNESEKHPPQHDTRDYFMEFMRGMNDAINLAKDKKFLKKYTEKYRTDKIDGKSAGKDAYELAKTCQKFFQENANEASKQFSNYLKYYKNLEKDLEKAHKNALKNEQKEAHKNHHSSHVSHPHHTSHAKHHDAHKKSHSSHHSQKKESNIIAKFFGKVVAVIKKFFLLPEKDVHEHKIAHHKHHEVHHDKPKHHEVHHDAHKHHETVHHKHHVVEHKQAHHKHAEHHAEKIVHGHHTKKVVEGRNDKSDLEHGKKRKQRDGDFSWTEHVSKKSRTDDNEMSR